LSRVVEGAYQPDEAVGVVDEDDVLLVEDGHEYVFRFAHPELF
jgi:hypothetical protein